jgi:hypothetical protein
MHEQPRRLTPEPATAQQSDLKRYPRVRRAGSTTCLTQSPWSPGALIHIRDIHQRPRQAMHDGHTACFDEEASRTTLKHRVLPAEAHTQLTQHSLNKLLLGEETLATISRQLSYIAQQAHQRFAQAFRGSKGQTSIPWTPAVGSDEYGRCLFPTFLFQRQGIDYPRQSEHGDKYPVLQACCKTVSVRCVQ